LFFGQAGHRDLPLNAMPHHIARRRSRSTERMPGSAGGEDRPPAAA